MVTPLLIAEGSPSLLAKTPPISQVNQRYSNWTYKVLLGGCVIGTIATIASWVLAQYATTFWAGALTISSFIGAHYYKPIESLQDDLNLVDKANQDVVADEKNALIINKDLNDKINRLQKVIDDNNQKLAQFQKSLEASQQELTKDQQQLSKLKPLADQIAKMTLDLQQHVQQFSGAANSIGSSVGKLATTETDLKAENDRLERAIVDLRGDSADQAKSMGILLESLAKKIENLKALNSALKKYKEDILAALSASDSVEKDAKEATSQLLATAKELHAATMELTKYSSKNKEKKA